jgi:hypothetical protein
MVTTGASAATIGSASVGDGSSGDDEGLETSGAATDDGVDDGADGSSGAGTKLDVPDGSGEGGACSDPGDICCLEAGEIPPHTLLDAFLAMYPEAAMPKTLADIQMFAPIADGHAIAWSDENVGGELIDPDNGGVIEANIAAGRELARQAAVLAMPADAMGIATREDPVVLVVLPGEGVCNGVGWAWGSMLFENADLSIGELVYLYIGMCADRDENADSEDVEVFYYSEDAVQICAAPG